MYYLSKLTKGKIKQNSFSIVTVRSKLCRVHLRESISRINGKQEMGKWKAYKITKQSSRLQFKDEEHRNPLYFLQTFKLQILLVWDVQVKDTFLLLCCEQYLILQQST